MGIFFFKISFFATFSAHFLWYNAYGELWICIENAKIKKPRKSDPRKIINKTCDFFENANFDPIFHIHNSPSQKCFLRKFWDRAFSRYDIAKKIVKSIQNRHKWAVSPFYSLAQYYLLPEHEKKLGGKKTWVKMQICKLRRITLSLTFLAIGPAPDPLYTLDPWHKRWMISPGYKEEYHP